MGGFGAISSPFGRPLWSNTARCRNHTCIKCSPRKMRACARAAYTLLEASNPALRRNSELFLEIIRFIWEANPSYDIYREFNKRHLIVPYKVHELISARLKVEKQEQLRVPLPISAPTRRAGTRVDFSSGCLDAARPALQGARSRIATPVHISPELSEHDRARCHLVRRSGCRLAWHAMVAELQVRGDDAGTSERSVDRLRTRPIFLRRLLHVLVEEHDGVLTALICIGSGS